MAFSPEKLELFKDLEAKANIMSMLDRLNLVRMPRFDAVTALSQGILRLHTRNINLIGGDNLRKTIDESDKQKKRRRFTLRHKADVEAFIFRAGLESSGFGDIANNTVWIAGVNMLKRPQIFPFSFAEEVVYMATVEDVAASSEFLNDSTLSPEEKMKVRWIDSTFRHNNEKAKSSLLAASEEGKDIVFYPEGGRSKDGYLRRAPRGVSPLLPRDNSALITPVVINGGEIINPPGGTWGPHKILPENRQDVEVIVGEYYPSSYPWRIHRMDKNITPSDVSMAYIAHLYPVSVRPEDMEDYRRIMVLLGQIKVPVA